MGPPNAGDKPNANRSFAKRQWQFRAGKSRPGRMTIWANLALGIAVGRAIRDRLVLIAAMVPIAVTAAVSAGWRLREAITGLRRPSSFSGRVAASR
jgi:hypothetical protein